MYQEDSDKTDPRPTGFINSFVKCLESVVNKDETHTTHDMSFSSIALATWLTEQISAEHCEFTPLSFKVNSDGWSNLLIDINHCWMLRLSRYVTDVQRQLPPPRFELENRLISALTDAGMDSALLPQSSLFNPALQSLADTAHQSAIPERAIAMLYPKITGRHPTNEDFSGSSLNELAHGVALFLAKLHSLPLASVAQNAVSDSATSELSSYPYGDEFFLNDILPSTLKYLSPRGKHAAYTYFEDACNQFELHSTVPKVICHGDLGLGNLLVNPEGTLAGVLDFSDICIGDPAMDFAPLWRRAPQHFVENILHHYRTLLPTGQWQKSQPQSLTERICFQTLRKAAFVVWYAEQYGFKEGMTASLNYLTQHFD